MALAAARERKEQLATEAESIASRADWRRGADRLRELLEEWKALPRLERGADEQLWRRFSAARTAYSRRRRQHFAEVAQQREGARSAKERLATEAETLASSTDWGPTAARFRDLMRQWKAAGHAGKADEERLWARFRSAQDQFFSARDAVTAERDRKLSANAERKEALLAEAEGLLPLGDPRAARTAFRDIAARWDAVGTVPRAQVKSLEARFRKAEQAVRGAEEERRRRDNPEARARAEATVRQLESLIDGLEQDLTRARDAADGDRASAIEESLDARRSWLAQARRTLDEFTPPGS